METKNEKRERIRKTYAPKGERSQKLMSFRVDNEVADWLSQQHNKGRYINELILEDKKRRSSL